MCEDYGCKDKKQCAGNEDGEKMKWALEGFHLFLFFYAPLVELYIILHYFGWRKGKNNEHITTNKVERAQVHRYP